jgi:hypothetical protein
MVRNSRWIVPLRTESLEGNSAATVNYPSLLFEIQRGEGIITHHHIVLAQHSLK